MAKQTEYAILVEPLADAHGGGWLAGVRTSLARLHGRRRNPRGGAGGCAERHR
jgi:hypothetical protein